MLTKRINNKQNDLEDQLLDVIRQLSAKPLQSQQKRYKSLKQILMMVSIIALSSFYFGYAMIYLSSIDFVTIIKIYEITMTPQVAQGLLVACVPIGGGLGAVSSPIFIQHFSRRKCILIINFMALIAGLLLYVPNFYFFMFVRLFQGYCTGVMSSVAPLIIKQISPTQISGTLASCHQIFITCGCTFGFVFSLFLSGILNDYTGQKKWWIVFGFPMIILLVQTYFLTTTYTIQTPKYLILNNREDQAKQFVQKIYKSQYVQAVFKQMKNNLKHDQQTAQQIQIPQINSQFKAKNNKNSQNPENHMTHNKLQTPRSAMIAAIHLAVLQQLCGVNAVVAYGGEIVGEKQPALKLAMPIIINMLQFIGSILTAFLLTKIGRKLLLEMGALTTSVGTVIVAIGFMSNSLAWILIGLIFFMACFGLTLGPVVWIYLPQVAQPKILSFATALNWASCSAILLLFPILKNMLPGNNPALLFLFFSIWSIGSYFFNKKYVLQTRNKGQRQIFQQYTALKTVF